MSKKKKVLVIIFVILLIFTIILPLLVNANIVNKLIKSRLEVILSKTINGECRIGKLSANIFSFHVDTLYISNDNIISQIEEIEIGLSIYSLITGRILINFIEISDVFINVKTKNNSEIVVEETNTQLNKYYYQYPLSDFTNNIDIKTIKVKNFHLQYDTFFISNISLNSSISLNRNRIILFYKLMNGNVDKYLNIIPSEGEIVLNKEGGILQGDIRFKEASINYDIMLLDSNINIKYIKGDINLKNISILNHIYSLNGNYDLKGIVSSDEYYINMFTHINNVIIDSISVDNMEMDASLRNDSIIIKRITVNNKFTDLYATGMIENNQFPSSEFELKIDRFESSKFPFLNKYHHFGVKGNVGLKISDFSNITLFVNDFSGEIGGDSIKIIDGSLSYIQNMFCTNQFTLLYNDGLMSIRGQVKANEGNLNIYFNKFPAMKFIQQLTDVNANGRINGNVDINGGWLNPFVEFQLDFEDVDCYGIEISNVGLSGYLATTENKIPDILLTLNGINAKYKGYNIPIIYFEISKDGYNMYSTMSAFSDAGLFEYEGDFAYDEIRNKFYGLVRQMKLKNENGSIYLSKPVYINICEDTIEVSDIDIYGKGMNTSFAFEMIDDSFEMHAEYYEDSFGLLNRFSGGNISGNIFAYIYALGTYEDPDIEVIVNSSNLNIFGIELDSFNVKSNLVNNIVNIDKLSFFSGDYTSNINGEIFMNDLHDLSHDSISINVDLNHIDGSYFVPLSDIVEIDEGYADVTASIKGTLENPLLSGDVYLNKVNLSIVDLGTKITNINGNAYFKGDSLIVEKVTGISGAGDVLVNGSITKKQYMFDRYNFNIIANEINVNGIDYTDVTADCRINVQGSETVPEISGTVNVKNGISTIPLISNSNGYAPTTVDSTIVDIKIKSEGGLWLKNEILDVEIAGDIHLLKNADILRISGDVAVKRGYYYYIDRKFKINKGYITLLQSKKSVDPIINIESYTKVNYNDIGGYKEATVYLNVTGNVDKPEFLFYSKPEMSPEEIISILSFNTSIAALREIGTLSRSLPEKALQMYIRNNYLRALSSSIGLDELSVETSLLSEEKTAKLSIGKYIHKNLYISYTHDIFTFAKDLFQIEYSIGNNSQIITERDEDGNINAGFQFKIRY